MTSTPNAEENQAALKPVLRQLSLIPVGLKEAALDSPTFRATAVHYGEQIDHIERWLENFARAASRLVGDVGSLEGHMNSYLSTCMPPPQVSEAALDHDYTLLGAKRYTEGVRASAANMLRWIKRLEPTVAEPIRAFLQNDLKRLKDARKDLEISQRAFDAALSRYLGQVKTKEASSLREDAFQLHEARKVYLKASMDFCVLAPQSRNNLDKLISKVCSDQWKEMKQSRENIMGILESASPEMDRVRGWSREMENSEMVFRRELAMARRQIEDSAETAARPSRELDAYTIHSVPVAAKAPPGTVPSSSQSSSGKAEKQSWLFQKTAAGKPARTVWVRRWFFVKHGIFGWLAQGIRSGAVEESEKIGVLLCGVRPAAGEERRFCFEVKTKDTTITLQAETQAELSDWLNAFDLAKRKALEGSQTVGSTDAGAPEPAFAINPPSAPEFAAKTGDGTASGALEDGALERSGTLPVPDPSSGSLAVRGGSVDVPRRSMTERLEGESGRDHAARIIQKLDLHRKVTTPTFQPPPSSAPAPGGIASVVSGGHGFTPIGVGTTASAAVLDINPQTDGPPSFSLAPSTLVIAPAPTNLSKTAVIVSGERGLVIGSATGIVPGGLMANLWGSAEWAPLDKLTTQDVRSLAPGDSSRRSNPLVGPPAASDGPADDQNDTALDPTPALPRVPSPSAHRKSASTAVLPDVKDLKLVSRTPMYPPNYPLPLKAQDAQFRMLFPGVPRDEHLVMVFRAMWNPNDQQEFPGRVYATTRNLYFYSHHLGMVLVTGASLSGVNEVTAARGRDCDFLFLHFGEGIRPDGSTRVTIKVFLEPLELLERRLNYLVQNAVSDPPARAEDVIKILIRMEGSDDGSSPEAGNWEEESVSTPNEGPPPKRGNEYQASLRLDSNLFKGGLYPDHVNRNATKFKLPSQPVLYTPQGMTENTMEREYELSAKALFHMIFGDKSTMFHALYANLSGRALVRTPWTTKDNGNYRREFQIEADSSILAYQAIEVLNEHLCYVVSDRRRPTTLPKAENFSVLTKIVITHISKSRSKLGIWTRIDWHKKTFAKGTISRYAMEGARNISEQLAQLANEQASTARHPFSSRQATLLYGEVGLMTTDTTISPQSDNASGGQFWKSSCDRAPGQGSLTLTLPGLLLIEAKQDISYAAGTFGSSFWTAMSNWITALSAHKLLVYLLILCLALNFFFMSRDSWQWYVERNARRYMKNLGVHPGLVLQKSIRVQGMMDMIHDSQNITLFEATDGKSCRSLFRTLLDDTIDDRATLDAPLSTSFQTSMHRLGTHRHDLLVSLRMVGRVEQQVVQAEWERWLYGESEKCRGMQKMLHANDPADGDTTFEDLRGWWNEHCGDCLAEAEKLL